MSKEGPKLPLTSAPTLTQRYDNALLPPFPTSTLPAGLYPESMLPAFALPTIEMEKARVERLLREIETDIQLLQLEKERLTNYKARLKSPAR